ncbi:MAG: hypothetical protein FD180_1471 [Planctomycetota bacterium]|nr:MAG: hypothetical protein FD180_1471 [Planctomycetota bacterium]
MTKRPDDGSAWYNLACCLALLERKNDAISALEQAVKGGFKDANHMKSDPDLKSIRKKKAYKAIVKEIDTASGTKPKTEWIAGDALLPCYVRKPKGYDSTKTYGLLILLHGRGDTAEHFLEGVEDWRGEDFLVASLETPYVLALPGGRNGRCWAPWESGKENTKEAYKLSAATVERALKSLKEKYPVNPKKVYLLGFSEGAFMAAHCGLQYADQISGTIVISGGHDPSLVAEADFEKAKGIRILIAHGTSDSVVPYVTGKKFVEALEKHGVKHDFFPFAGGHSLPQVVRDGVHGWMRGNEIPAESMDKEGK